MERGRGGKGGGEGKGKVGETTCLTSPHWLLPRIPPSLHNNSFLIFSHKVLTTHVHVSYHHHQHYKCIRFRRKKNNLKVYSLIRKELVFEYGRVRREKRNTCVSYITGKCSCKKIKLSFNAQYIVRHTQLKLAVWYFSKM